LRAVVVTAPVTLSRAPLADRLLELLELELVVRVVDRLRAGLVLARLRLGLGLPVVFERLALGFDALACRLLVAPELLRLRDGRVDCAMGSPPHVLPLGRRFGGRRRIGSCHLGFPCWPFAGGPRRRRTRPDGIESP
jgi:hypothetical protein